MFIIDGEMVVLTSSTSLNTLSGPLIRDQILVMDRKTDRESEREREKESDPCLIATLIIDDGRAIFRTLNLQFLWEE